MASIRPRRSAIKPRYEEQDSSEAEQSDVEMEVGAQTGSKGGKGTKQGGNASRRGRSDSDSDGEQNRKPHKKKTRKAKSQKPKNKGKFVFFKTMPLDVIHEILTHLEPGCLLSLTRTSKSFRTMLVSPGSNSIWASARALVGHPALIANDLSEVQYASLVFGTCCQDCGSGDVDQADFHLRRRLCEDCEKSSLVKLKRLKKLFPDLHPATTSCVPVTDWGRSARLADVQYYSIELWELQLRDDLTRDQLHQAEQQRSRTCGRLGSGTAPTELERTLSPPRKAFLVDEFVLKRKEKLRKVNVDRTGITIAMEAIEDKRDKELKKLKAAELRVKRNRRKAIRGKVKQLGWTEDDFVGSWFTSHIINKAEQLTSEVWLKIQPRIIKLLEDNKRSRQAAALASRQRVRQTPIRDPYNNLKDSQSTDFEKATFPLFCDFLNLPSIRPMWEAEDAVFSQAEWDSSLEIIDLDVEEHSEALRVHAIKTILAATTETDYEELDDDPETYSMDHYDDAFFDRPTSFLMCGFVDCCYIYYIRQRGRFRPVGPIPVRHFDSLVGLLTHQHEHHQHSEVPTLAKRFSLPFEVVATLSAIIEVGDLEDETATKEDLDALGETLRWDNSYARHVERGWRQLINCVHYKSGKAPKDCPLDVPVISRMVKKPRRQ